MKMAKSKEEAIIIYEDNEPKELKGAELEAFLADRAQIQKEINDEKVALEARKAARLSALQKLGLTEEEINAIL
jgi:hypothetical protein